MTTAQMQYVTIVLIIFSIINLRSKINGEFFPLRKGRDDNERNYTSSATITDFDVSSTEITTPFSSDTIIGTTTSEHYHLGMLYPSSRNNVTGEHGEDVTTLSSQDTTEVIAGSTVNITANVIENDDADTSLTDFQTWSIACLFTVLSLISTLVIGFAIRTCYRKYVRNRDTDIYDGMLNKDESSAPLKGNLTLSTDELKTAESQFSIIDGQTNTTAGSINSTNLLVENINTTGINNVASPTLYRINSTDSRGTSTNHTGTNGSIITMTLKNNHLIVETEERNDICENSRETTMKYSPSNHDSVFVVEVQQGVRRNSPASVTYPATPSSPENTSDRALVHHPPAESTIDLDLHSNTGLSQSDLSESSNNSYKYGNQQGYDNGHYGYSNYNGYDIEKIPMGVIPSESPLDPDKPIIKAAIFKSSPNQTSMDIPDIRRKSQSFEPRLWSDIQAKERIMLENEEADLAKEQQEEEVRNNVEKVEETAAIIVETSTS